MKIKEIINKLKKVLDENKVIKDVKLFEIDNENDLLDYYISKLGNSNHDAELSIVFNKSIKSISTRRNYLINMELIGNYGISKNHNLIYEIFDKLNQMFNNESIEHYYTSGILSYILINRPLERFHHDIDVFINEDCLNKLEEISLNYGFSFARVPGIRNDGTTRIMLKMYYEDVDIPITIFMYEKENDNSITQKDYYYNNDDTVLRVENIYNSAEIAKLSFDEKYYYHNNIPFKSISKEALYLSKEGNRKKDIYDCNVMKEYVDFEKLNRLKHAYMINKLNESMIVMDEDRKAFMTKQNKTFQRKLVYEK